MDDSRICPAADSGDAGAAAAADAAVGRAQSPSREPLLAAFRSFPDACAITDAVGSITFLNTAAEDLTGWSLAEAAGLPAGEVVRLVAAATGQSTDPVGQVLAGARRGISLAGASLVDRSGCDHAVEGQAAPFLGDAGVLAGVVLVCRRVAADPDRPVTAALRQRTAALDAILAAQNDAVLVYDADRNVIRTNPAFAATYGFNPCGLHVTEIALRVECRRLDGRPFVWEEQPTPRALRGDAVRGAVFAVKRADGTDAIVETSSGPIREGSRVVGTVTVWHDVTDRVRAEERAQALAESIQRERDTLSALVDSISDEVWFADAQGRFTLANPSARREFGPAAADGVGIEELVGRLEVHRADGSVRPVGEAPAMRALRGEVVRNCEEIIRTPRSADLRYREVSSAPVRDARGEIIGSVSVVRDVTEHRRAEEATRESEERYRSLFNSMSDGFALHEIVCDADGTPCDFRFLDVNPAFEKLTGLKREDVIGALHNTLLPDDDPLWVRVYGQVALTGEPLSLQNYSPALKRHYEVFAYSPRHGQFAAVFRDITERKEREQEVEALNERLRRAMRETHHRVKNNLQIVAAMLDMQAMEHPESVPVSQLQHLGGHIRTLAAVHDVLTQQATQTGDADSVSARAVLGRLLEMLAGTATGRRVRYSLDDAPLSPRQSTSLALVASELVNNALKHGGSEVDVSFVVSEGQATLTVSDDGPGFPPGFDPATAAHTGLELVSNLGRWDLAGTIAYANRPQGGASVTLAFRL